MKAKTPAVLAIVLIPLLFLGVGVFVATRHSSSKPAAPAKSGPSMVETWLEEGRAKAPVAPKPLEKAVTTPVDRARLRYEIVTCLERIRYVGGRSGECKRLWPEAATEEEGRALQREKVALDKEWGELSGLLCELAAKDPSLIVEMVRTAHDVPQRLSLMGLIVPELIAEMVSEDAPSGPLLTGLLTMAAGDADERAHLAALAGHLGRVNHELGRALVSLINDSDLHVRIHAAHSLAAAAGNGYLREFLSGELPSLKRAALCNEYGNDCHTRANALKTLAFLGNDEADQFILHQFETLESRDDYGRVEAVVFAASRIAERHEARLVMAIQRAFDLPFYEDIHYELRRLARHLSADQQAALSVVAAQKPGPESMSMTNWIAHWSSRGSGRTLMRVEPFTEERPSHPTIRRRRVAD